MLLVTGSASYNKKPGTLAVSANGKTTTWTATGDKEPSKQFDVAHVTNLQQTPPSSAKVSLRIVELLPDTQEQKNHTFQFSPDDDGRAQAAAIREVLAKAISEFKNVSPLPAAAPSAAVDGAPAAMAIAAAVSARGPGSQRVEFDDSTLLSDQGLQQGLLQTNKQLGSVFAESMKARPDSISVAAFHKQFWSSRVKLLRAFAVQQKQKKGDYNVLATIHPRLEGQELKLSVTPEQVSLILSQHPVVRKAKAQLSSKLSESEFWTRFFRSRLFKKLKGEKITEHDGRDEMMDKYLNAPDDDLEREKRLLAAHVPHTIDLAGNEQDNSQRQGNAPDRDNRPSAPDRVPIMRTINALSEKLVSQMAPNDVNPSAPIGVDEATFREMQLRDLTAHAEPSRVELKIRDKAKFFASGKGGEESQVKHLLAEQDPEEVLKSVRSDLAGSTHKSLTEATGLDDSDSEDEGEDGAAPKKAVFGSKSSRRKATQQVFQSVKDRRARATDTLASLENAEIALELGLEPLTYHNLTLLQASNQVFIKYFWSVYNAGDASRAGELEGVVEALTSELARIGEAGKSAEEERKKKLEETREIYRAHYQRTGVKQRFDPESIKGGRKMVEQLMSATTRTIRCALDTYKKALEAAQLSEAQSKLVQHGGIQRND